MERRDRMCSTWNTCSPSQIALLEAFAGLVRTYSSRLDLVAPGDVERLRERHVEDCLRLSPLVDRSRGRCADVGSGAGFPGIPLAIVHPHRDWVLIEPRRGRVAFLEEVVRRLDLGNVRVEPKRAEEISPDFGLVVARALAAPSEALRICSALVAPPGLAAVFIGERAEIPAAAEKWSEGIAIVRVPEPAE